MNIVNPFTNFKIKFSMCIEFQFQLIIYVLGFKKCPCKRCLVEPCCYIRCKEYISYNDIANMLPRNVLKLLVGPLVSLLFIILWFIIIFEPYVDWELLAGKNKGQL